MFIISQPPSVAKTSDGNEMGKENCYSLPTLFLKQDGGDIQDMKEDDHSRMEFQPTDSGDQM